MTVLIAVAEAMARSAFEIDPLAEWTDPEALDSLVLNTPDEVTAPTVTFEYIGWQVTVSRDRLQIAPRNGD